LFYCDNSYELTGLQAILLFSK